MGDIKLGVIEAKFADMIWQNEPVSSSQLVRLAQDALSWKKSTTYTVLKRLCDRGIFRIRMVCDRLYFQGCILCCAERAVCRRDFRRVTAGLCRGVQQQKKAVRAGDRPVGTADQRDAEVTTRWT